jgi:hypothetical protein
MERAKKIFAGEFNERIFRETLTYFDDINYREPVEFLPGFEVSERKVKTALKKFAVA